ncbi:MAG: glycosyltransferase, partial [Candidatus Thermoplasmatota archaeon]|nr:glycosyltransferase [Candidatus Thermoplasmatota archaeon]
MKILQVTNFFKPSWESGGPARVVYEVSKQLVQRGHEVTVYTTDGFKSRVNVEKNKPVDVDGITTYYFRNLSLTAASMNLPIPYHMPSVIRKEIDKFDIIHIHEHRTILAAIVTYYAKKYNIPFVLQPRGSAQKNGKIFLKTIFDLIFGYKILKNAKKVILSSNNEYYISKDILKNGGVEKKNIEYIPNGIDVYSYQNITSRSNFLESYDIKISEKVILYLGRIHKVKGLDLLVESFKDIITERKDVSLFIIGPDNGYKDKLR